MHYIQLIISCSFVLSSPYHHHQCFTAQGHVLHCKVEEPRLQFYQRQVFHCKLRNQGCSFTRDWIGAVASCYFPHPTLSFASEQTLKGLKRSQGANVEVRRVDLANWALRTSPKFTIGVKYQFHQVFDLIRDPEIPITRRPPSPSLLIKSFVF